MNNNNLFIIQLCKLYDDNKNSLIELINSGLDYPYILGHLLYNRVGAIAYYTLKKYELLPLVNREFRNTLKSIYESNIEQSNSLILSLENLKSVLFKFNFKYALLKGAYLVQLYPLGLRTSNDIDVLIQSQNISELSEILISNDFARGSIKNDTYIPANRREIIFSRMNRGETVPFIKEVNYPKMKFLEIDVNFSLGFRPNMDEPAVDKFLSQTEPLIAENLQTLNNIDFLIHLCTHLFKEATVFSWVEMGRDVSLYKYCDIYLFVNKFFNYEYSTALISRTITLGLEREVFYALFYTRKLFDLNNKYLNDILNALQPNSLDYLKQVIRPSDNTRLHFKLDYIDWVFCSNRREHLYET